MIEVEYRGRPAAVHRKCPHAGRVERLPREAGAGERAGWLELAGRSLGCWRLKLAAAPAQQVVTHRMPRVLLGAGFDSQLGALMHGIQHAGEHWIILSPEGAANAAPFSLCQSCALVCGATCTIDPVSGQAWLKRTQLTHFAQAGRHVGQRHLTAGCTRYSSTSSTVKGYATCSLGRQASVTAAPDGRTRCPGGRTGGC